MSKRWSLQKKRGEISFTEFVIFVNQFILTLDSYFVGGAKVSIILYKELPCSPGRCDDFLINWLKEENKKKELYKYDSIANLSKDYFDQAVHIKVRVDPIEKDKNPFRSYGSISCKGLNNNTLRYYVQVGSLSKEIEDLILQKQRLFSNNSFFERLFSANNFFVGDGFKSLCRPSIT